MAIRIDSPPPFASDQGVGKRYRYVTPVRKGHWRPTLAEAKEAAARAGFGHRDEDGRVWLDIFTTIESDVPE